MRNNNLGAAGMGKLAGVLGECKALQTVDLNENDIGAEGAGRLADSLGECKALEFLFLNANNIGEEGAEKLANMLPECKALTRLVFSKNNIGAEGMGACEAVGRLQGTDWSKFEQQQSQSLGSREACARAERVQGVD